MGSKPWYSEGLRFECTGCGGCCTGAPGYVWVTQEEMRRIAEHIGEPDGRLSKQYARRVRLQHSLAEYENGDCVFLRWTGEGKAACAIYAVRPAQCRTWPFWEYNLKSSKTWQQIGKCCSGMDRGRQYSVDEIESRRKQNW